jgi:hypothetical protein
MNAPRYHAFRHQTAAEMFIKEWDGTHGSQVIAGKTIRLRVWIVGESEKPQFFDVHGTEIRTRNYSTTPVLTKS